MTSLEIFQISGPKMIIYLQVDGRLHSWQDLLELNAKMRKKHKIKYAAGRLGAKRYGRLEFSGRVGNPDLLPNVNDDLDITALATTKLLLGLAHKRKNATFTTPDDLKIFFDRYTGIHNLVEDWFETVWPALVLDRPIPSDKLVARFAYEREKADPATSMFWEELALAARGGRPRGMLW